MRIKLTPQRSSRFAAFVSPSAVAPQFTVTPASTTPNPSPAPPPPAALPPGSFTQTLTLGGATVQIVSTSPAPSAAGASLTSTEIDVLQRTRFHVGVGLLASRMRTQTYHVVNDTTAKTKTVSLVGESPNRKLPVATLAYSMLPLEGKVFGAQAYQFDLPHLSRPRRWTWRDNPVSWLGVTAWRTTKYAYTQNGVGATLGMSLEKPFENVFGGITTEVLPGVTVGFGRHYGYVPVATSTTLPAVVPYAAGEPVVNRWRQANAWTYTVDGAVIVSALGKLVGLK
jgi:hypothetical protein